MTSIIQSIASPTAMLYWLNLAVVVTLMCAASLVLVRICRNRSEIFRHAFLVVSLLVLLATPIAVWVGSHSQLGLLTIKDAHLVGSSSVHPLGAPWELPFPWEEFEGGPTFNDQNAVASEMASSPAHEATAPRPCLEGIFPGGKWGLAYCL